MTLRLNIHLHELKQHKSEWTAKRLLTAHMQ